MSQPPIHTRWLDQLQHQLATGDYSMPLGVTMGYRVSSLREGGAVVELQTDDRHFNFSGYTHGGVICTLMDTAMGMAALTMLEVEASSTTVEIKVNMLRPVWRANLRADARVVNNGRTLQLLECDVWDERDKLIAKAMGTWMILRGEHAAKRRRS